MISEIGREYAKGQTNLYDLGCSTGNSMYAMARTVDPEVSFIGIDYSQNMLDECALKLNSVIAGRQLKLNVGDLNDVIEIKNASVVNMCLTLQFVNPENRDRILKMLYQGLNKDGALILVEKLLGETEYFDENFIKFYYDMKKRNA